MSFDDTSDDSHISDAVSAGLDVVEIRIDRFHTSDPAEIVGHVQRFSDLPTIATIRTKAEGGGWEGTGDERLALFTAVAPQVDAIDIELLSTDILPDVVSLAKGLDRTVIISHHDFQKTPPRSELDAMARRAKEAGADLVKISTMAETLDDLRTLTAFLIDNVDLGLIVIAMGPHGVVSRVAFPVLGSRITYAFSGVPTVSGQLPFSDTFDMLRLFSPLYAERKIIELGILDGA